ncbi:MAG: 50S ribosomal protein L25 [Saprospiraceae bacterium]
MANVVINGVLRDSTGKKSSKLARANDDVPVVMYGPKEVIHFTAKVADFKTLIYTPEFKIAEVLVGDKKYRTILKAKQFHPISEALLHVDLLILTDGHPVKYEIPVNFVGSSPGVKVGGKFAHKLRRIKVKSLPENMVTELTASISSLELGQSLRVRDIEVTAGIEIMSQPATPIASVEIPRALRGKQ